MRIHSVFDPEFKAYGQIVTGLDETVQEILAALKTTPLPEGVGYVPTDPDLQELPAAVEVSEHCFGGMPVQLGWCNGHNTRLNCLEYHRDSEFNLGTEDFILLLARQEEIENGLLDTARVQSVQGACRGAGGGLCDHAALRPLPLRREQGLPRAGRPAVADQHRTPGYGKPDPGGYHHDRAQQVAAGPPRIQ